MRFMTKDGKKWVKETPTDVSKWLWRHDGTESVAIDDDTSTYYCGIPSMLDTYREAWEREGKPNDQRRAAMFIDLDMLIWAESEQNAA
jgi:hypothetical protein